MRPSPKIGHVEIQWIGIAFVFGLVARRLGQPPLLGFLAAGFGLELLGLRPDASLIELAHVGILLLLFTIGLKLDLRALLTRHVLGTSAIHLATSTGVLLALIVGLGAAGVGLGLDFGATAIVAFALSFSSTVFAVKLLEERDDMSSLYGRIAIGILIVQDIGAVVFLAVSKGEWPSLYAPLLLALVFARPLFHRGLALCGHGELLVLAGLAAALGGAALFDAVGIKSDFGALAAGVLLGGHDKSRELAKSLLGLKEVFLVGFFLTVGLTGLPTLDMLGVALLLLLALPLKGMLFLGLMTRFRLRGRTAWLSTLALTSYSEFGLIVVGVAATQGWLPERWLVTLAIAMGLSFVLGTGLNRFAFELYRRLRRRLARLESPHRLPEEAPVVLENARVLVFGMGRIGARAYDKVKDTLGDVVVGFDIDALRVDSHRASQRRVHVASATDADFWERLHIDQDSVSLVLLALTSQEDNRVAIRQLRAEGYRGPLAATARFADEVEVLREEGADVAFEVLADAGTAFAANALEALESRVEARTNTT
ncbi:MAG: cation:proton antiporter [Sandaracinaceae bacterium]